MKSMILAISLLLFGTAALPQNAVNLAVTGAGAGSVTPVATWSTSPAGASCTASGGWSGSKNASGTNVTLPAITSTTSYTLTCAWPGSAGTAQIAWTPPIENTDDSALTDLAGYKILLGPSATNLNQSATISDPAARSASIGSLTPGSTYFFVVRAVNAKGTESANSLAVQKLIVGGAPVTASKTATVTVDKVPDPPTGVTVIETTAYSVRPDLQRFVFLRGSRAGTVKKGARCDESRRTEDGYNVISRLSQVTPRPAEGTVLVARCG